MNNLSAYKYKNQIIQYAIGVFFVCELVSLLFLKFNFHFLYGLLLGTAVAIVNFNALYFVSLLICKTGQNGFMLSFFTSVIRLMIFGIVFYAALKISTLAAFAAVIGFVTIKAGIYCFNIRQMIQNRASKAK